MTCVAVKRESLILDHVSRTWPNLGNLLNVWGSRVDQGKDARGAIVFDSGQCGPRW